jgi:hypothetical protein
MPEKLALGLDQFAGSGSRSAISSATRRTGWVGPPPSFSLSIRSTVRPGSISAACLCSAGRRREALRPIGSSSSEPPAIGMGPGNFGACPSGNSRRVRGGRGNCGSTNASHDAAWVASCTGLLSSRGTRRPGPSSPQEPDWVGVSSTPSCLSKASIYPLRSEPHRLRQLRMVL